MRIAEACATDASVRESTDLGERQEVFAEPALIDEDHCRDRDRRYPARLGSART
jgi:hypothetical protein